MLQTKKLAFCILFVLLTAAAAVSAQPSDRWGRLSSVKMGTKLIVDQDNGRVIKGKFTRVTDASLVVKVGSGEVSLPRESIAAVHGSKRSSRVKRALVGALAGAGAGIAIGVAAVTLGNADPLIGAGGVLIGVPSGAVIGAATASSKKGELLYSR